MIVVCWVCMLSFYGIILSNIYAITSFYRELISVNSSMLLILSLLKFFMSRAVVIVLYGL